MKKRLIAQSLFLLFGLILLHCARNKGNPVGAAYFQRDNMGTEIHVDYQPVTQDTSFKTYVNTVSSPFLFLGELPDITSKILLLFTVLPPDSAVVDSARVTIHAENIIGEPTGSFTATVHQVLNDWDIFDVTWETFTDDMIGTELASFEISADDITASGDSLAYTFDLPADIVQSWVDSTTNESNHGIVICPSPSDFIVDFIGDDATDQSTEDLGPKLYVRYTTDTVRMSTYTATADLFLADIEKELTEDILDVGNGSAFHAYIKLDLDTIPPNATINRALLTLTSDTTLSFPSHGDLFAATVFSVVDDVWTAPEVGLDSTTFYTAGVYGDTLMFTLTDLVQEWTAGIRDNFGLLIAGNSERVNLNQRGFYSMTADPALRPRIKINYSLPPSSRY